MKFLIFILMSLPGAFAQPSVEDVFERWTKLTALRLNLAFSSRQIYFPITQRSVAARLTVSHTSLSRALAGTVPLSLRLGTVLARELSVPIEWLLAYDFLREEFPVERDVRPSEVRCIGVRSARQFVANAREMSSPLIWPPLALGCELQLIPTEALENELLRRRASAADPG